jgi:hypothetical protein
MEEDNLIEFVIGNIIKNAPGYNLKIEGNPSAKWFILRDAHLASYFSSATCEILVRFEVDRRMVILFPEHISTDYKNEPRVCSLFLGKEEYMPGWRQVCPYLIKDIYEACFENIAVFLQFVQNPILCGIHNCDQQVAYEKLWAENEYEWPGDKKEDFKYEDDIEEHDKED